MCACTARSTKRGRSSWRRMKRLMTCLSSSLACARSLYASICAPESQSRSAVSLFRCDYIPSKSCGPRVPLPGATGWVSKPSTRCRILLCPGPLAGP
eukprot:6411850-Prymnesium_polylepis.1